MHIRLVGFLLIYFAFVHTLFSQGFKINNFGPNVYKASPNNYFGFEAANGIWYFANENGILQYDGSLWKLIPIDNYSSVHSLAQLKGDTTKIYVGGYNEFGYIEKIADTESYQYHSLKKTSIGQLSEIWNIVTTDHSVYFECREKILKYDGKSIQVYDERDDVYLFLINERPFASIYGKGLAQITDSSMQIFNTDFQFDEDAVFKALPLATDSLQRHLLVTSFNGLYTYQNDTSKVVHWNTEIDELLKSDGIADVVVWRDSSYAITTRSSGLIFLDFEGKVQKGLGENAPSSSSTDKIKTLFDALDTKIEGLVNEDNGLPSNQLRSMFQDIRGNLWVSSLYGISYLDWDLSYNALEFEPKTILTKALLNTSDTVNSRSIQFEFATPGYDQSDLEYSYYLEGFEKDWLPWTDHVEKEYTNLDGGIYKFHVKARVDGGKETQEVIYTFGVPTLWYKNIWTYLFGVAVLSVLIFFGLRYRTIRLKKLNRRLESIIENRTKELVLQREQLKSANEELIVTNTELDNFVYRSSHDLVAPLKSIRGLVIVAKKDNPSTNQLTYLTMMEQSVLKLEDFIKSIMEYSTNAKKDLELSEIVLKDLVEEVMEELRFYDNRDKVELIKDFDEAQIITSDEERLKIVMSNLIINAIKYHNYKQEHPTITIRSNQNADHYTIEVVDNGHGIEPQHVEKVFDMFFRASDHSEGSGLGLYIVRDTVAKLNGSVTVHSELNTGSVFKVILPRPE
ncbi:MAG: ATP-binding protein [Bacteroidota bacterium]